MKRRAIQLGGRTLLVSIPYSWALEHGVTKGRELTVTETSQGLIVQTGDAKPKMKKAFIEAKNCGRLLRRIVLAYYLKGFNEVHVSHTSKEIKPLQNLSSDMIGFEITSQTQTTTIFQDFSEKDEKNYENVVSRAFMILKTMLAETFSNPGKETLESIKQMDLNLNKMCHYCWRYSYKNNLGSSESSILQIIANSLEKAGDAWKECVEMSIEENSQNTLKNIHQPIEKLLSAVLSFTLKRSSVHALECADAYDSIIELLKKSPRHKIFLPASQLVNNIINIQSLQLGMLNDVKSDEEF
ncbi:hypothetical protein HY483_00025 [Candidatus Woesearchaeota archaeon]|nr:hypothetical protein [Candidatus Woesearchaeota archaeon]